MNQTQKNDLRGYSYIRNQIVRTGITPSLREIARTVGYSSPRSAQLMLRRLANQSLISYLNGVIKLSPRNRSAPEQTVNIPLVGSVACGLPSLAEQEPETLVEVSTRIARPGHTYFLLRAKGTSMNKSGINNGDLVMVRQQPTAEEGEKVVALINDDATIKHFHRERDMIILRPNSTDKKHRPIVLSEEFLIQGVVKAVLPSDIY
jgi:repressor LexA